MNPAAPSAVLPLEEKRRSWSLPADGDRTSAVAVSSPEVTASASLDELVFGVFLAATDSALDGGGTDSTPSRQHPPVWLSDYTRLLSATRRGAGPSPVAGAPVRSAPHRTYDPLREDPEPEGRHVPMLLARLASEGERWDELKADLASFGAEAGLFRELDIRRKGGTPSDPFQVHVSVGRFPFNLMDVGYGVSQVLPVVVDALVATEPQCFLLQQPEVHLHPRAQAELGSLFAQAVAARGHRFVVEMHRPLMIATRHQPLSFTPGGQEIERLEREYLVAATVVGPRQGEPDEAAAIGDDRTVAQTPSDGVASGLLSYGGSKSTSDCLLPPLFRHSAVASPCLGSSRYH